MKVYTKTGDKGLTGLIGGTRVTKSDHRISLYGEVDELNSHVGLIRAYADKSFSQKDILKNIQSRLFDLGSQMACEPSEREKFNLPDIDDSHVLELENAIDSMSKNLPVLKNFVLPTGNPCAAHAHVARTVCRRVERNFVAFHKTNPDDLKDIHLIYINRLSDYLFVVARTLVNEAGLVEEIWNS